ncbi:MAG TPA: hypothetical protein QGH10_05495 [Armatimonadota bacterium]|nr:hypothetical protein [Armatimonadota bacterium]
MPAGRARDLLDYDYRADGPRVRRHIPTGIRRYVQKKAVVFGDSNIYLTVTGTGKATFAGADGE